MTFTPPGAGVVKSKTGLPDSEISNTFGIIFGASTALEALGGKKVVDNTFIESTASGQIAELQMKKQEFGIFETARILALRIKVRAISTGVADSTLRVELIVNGVENVTAARKDITIATTGIVEYTALFPGKEVIIGELQEIKIADLDDVVVKLTAQDGTNPVRVAKLEIETIFLPDATERNFFDDTPTNKGWTDSSDLSLTFTNDIITLDDTSATLFFQFTKSITPLTEFGAAATVFNTVGIWTTNVGVYSYTALSIDIGTEHFQVNLLEDGVEKIGLLKGQPSSFDPTLIGSYEDSAAFDWDDSEIHLVWIEWDETNVRVFTEQDLFNPILQATRASIGTGTGSPAVEFATAADVATKGSIGEIVVFSFDYRGIPAVGAPPNKLILDFKSREELALIGSSSSFKETILLWHHETVNFDQFKVRFEGVSHDSGFFIPTSGGSDNTEELSVDIQPGEIVRTVVNIEDLVINDFQPDGARTLRIYVRDKVTGLYNTLLTGALEIPIRIYRVPPIVRAVEFSLNEDTKISLTADREFSVRPEIEAIPPGSTQAANIETNPIGLIETDDPIIVDHIDGMPEDPTTIEFNQDPLITLELGDAKIKYIAKDVWGEEDLQLSTLIISTPNPFSDIRCDAGIRFSLPPTMRAKDPTLQDKYLPPWDAIACQFWDIAERMQTLTNAQTAPLNSLQFMFQEIGLVFPGDVAGYPEASLRRLLDNADSIHRSRFTLDGLSFYLGLLIPNVLVSISGFEEGLFIFLNSSVFGLPTVALINTSQSANDINNYLFGSIASSTITITITGVVSTEMQEFVRSTIRQEIPYADDPINPLDVQVVFVTP